MKLYPLKDQLKDSYDSGLTLRELSELHGVSIGTLTSFFDEIGVARRKPGRRKKNGPVEQVSQPDSV